MRNPSNDKQLWKNKQNSRLFNPVYKKRGVEKIRKETKFKLLQNLKLNALQRTNILKMRLLIHRCKSAIFCSSFC